MPEVVRLVGVQITDQDGYKRYRDAMTPLMHAAGGRFGIDVEVSRNLSPAGDAPINRLFTIHFPDEDALNAFFGSEAYQSVRAEHFNPSVSGSTIYGIYDANT